MDATADIFDLACAITGQQTPRAVQSSGARQGGSVCPNTAPARTYPAELVALAADHVATRRMGGVYNGLLDLIERAERECRCTRGGGDWIDRMALDALMALRIETEDRIQRAAEKAAEAEAIELAETLADMDLDEQREAFAVLDAAQKSAVIWAQARALAAGMSLTAAIGEPA